MGKFSGWIEHVLFAIGLTSQVLMAEEVAVQFADLSAVEADSVSDKVRELRDTLYADVEFARDIEHAREYLFAYAEALEACG